MLLPHPPLLLKQQVGPVPRENEKRLRLTKAKESAAVRFKRATLVSLAFGLMVVPAQAAKIGQFQKWTAHAVDSPQGKVCYIVAVPEKMLPKKVNRDDVFFYITTWAGQTKITEPSVVTGYPYQPSSTTTVSIGASTASMFTKGDSAWVADRANEKKLVNAMRAGSKMIVKGTSRRGTVTTDTYSLSGVTAGLKAIIKACS
ncbi:MAG: invasion associated locus B family protein [Hyphomicrobiales bacterium]